jgi:DNA-binding NarL/FixJ family response regulator
LTDEGPNDAREARVLIADDHAMVRVGLRSVLEDEPDLEVVGEAKNGREALKLCQSLRPDIVLMDVRMPEVDGLAATRAIKREFPTVSVLMVTMHENPDYLLEAVKAGAAGYILKDTPSDRLVSAVRRTLNGKHPLNQELSMQLMKRLAQEPAQGAETPPQAGPRQDPSIKGLTSREIEVLRLIAQGNSNLQIADNLVISRGTAKTHVQRIIQKLGVSDRTQAAVHAIKMGLLEYRTEG